jgi:glycerate 2-kinase
MESVDAAHRPHRVQWWWHSATRTAIIESATVIGLALLPPKAYHPFQLDSYGLGAVIRAACEARASRCLIGLGGSATNDGGFGLARALGFEFHDESGQSITSWTGLASLATIVPPARTTPGPPVEGAVDVQNPLLGARGCSRVYGPQKGLLEEDFPRAEACLARLAQVRQQAGGRDDAAEPGAGAAGGLGYGLRTFLNAHLRPGFALFAEMVKLSARLERTELVLTGEGALDESSLMGKGVGELARLCQAKNIPCLGLVGRIQDRSRIGAGFQKLYGLSPELTTPSQALAEPARWLALAAEKAAREYTLTQQPQS